MFQGSHQQKCDFYCKDVLKTTLLIRWWSTDLVQKQHHDVRAQEQALSSSTRVATQVVPKRHMCILF